MSKAAVTLETQNGVQLHLVVDTVSCDMDTSEQELMRQRADQTGAGLLFAAVSLMYNRDQAQDCYA